MCTSPYPSYVLVIFCISLIASLFQGIHGACLWRRGPQQPGPGQTLAVRYHRKFIWISAARLVASTGVKLGFFIINLSSSCEYSVYLLSSIVILSMIHQGLWTSGMSSSTMWRAFNPIRVVVISLLLGGCFIEGVVLEFTKSDAGIVMMFVSMAIFRFYMASEWALFMKETQPYSPNNRYSGRTARGFTIEFITTTALYILSITIEATTHSRSLYRGLNALIVISAIYALHDLVTDGWITLTVINRTTTNHMGGWIGHENNTDQIALISRDRAWDRMSSRQVPV